MSFKPQPDSSERLLVLAITILILLTVGLTLLGLASCSYCREDGFTRTCYGDGHDIHLPLPLMRLQPRRPQDRRRPGTIVDCPCCGAVLATQAKRGHPMRLAWNHEVYSRDRARAYGIARLAELMETRQ